MAQVEILINFVKFETQHLRSNMKYLLLLFVYFFSTVSLANHCSSGASHDGPNRQADQKGYMESSDAYINEKKVKDESSKSIGNNPKDKEINL